MRLQDTYRLDPAHLARGDLDGVHYGTTLTAHDCFELGRQSYNVGDHDHTAMWMRQALDAWAAEDEKTVDRADIYEYMAFSAYVQGNMRRALKLTDDLLQLQPDHPRAAGNKVYYENALKSEGGEMNKRGEWQSGRLVRHCYSFHAVELALEHCRQKQWPTKNSGIYRSL